MRLFSSLAVSVMAASCFMSLNGAELFSNSRDKLFSIAGTNVDSSSGDERLAGVAYNTESIKGSLQKGSDTFAGTLGVKLNFADRTYLKAAFGYMDHDYQGNVNAKSYSGSMGLGYLVRDDLYIEAGGGKSKQEMQITDLNLSGPSAYRAPRYMSGKITDTIYVGASKRFETKVGRLDVYGNAGRNYPPLGKERNFYTAGFAAYPQDNLLIGYSYNYMQDNIINRFFVEYGYLIASYTDALNRDYQVATAGVQFAFTDVLNVGTYTAPRNIKRHISE